MTPGPLLGEVVVVPDRPLVWDADIATGGRGGPGLVRQLVGGRGPAGAEICQTGLPGGRALAGGGKAFALDPGTCDGPGPPGRRLPARRGTKNQRAGAGGRLVRPQRRRRPDHGRSARANSRRPGGDRRAILAAAAGVCRPAAALARPAQPLGMDRRRPRAPAGRAAGRRQSAHDRGRARWWSAICLGSGSSAAATWPTRRFWPCSPPRPGRPCRSDGGGSSLFIPSRTRSRRGRGRSWRPPPPRRSLPTSPTPLCSMFSTCAGPRRRPGGDPRGQIAGGSHRASGGSSGRQGGILLILGDDELLDAWKWLKLDRAKQIVRRPGVVWLSDDELPPSTKNRIRLMSTLTELGVPLAAPGPKEKEP